jgi:hypothetical protein
MTTYRASQFLWAKIYLLIILPHKLPRKTRKSQENCQLSSYKITFSMWNRPFAIQKLRCYKQKESLEPLERPKTSFSKYPFLAIILFFPESKKAIWKTLFATKPLKKFIKKCWVSLSKNKFSTLPKNRNSGKSTILKCRATTRTTSSGQLPPVP